MWTGCRTFDLFPSGALRTWVLLAALVLVANGVSSWDADLDPAFSFNGLAHVGIGSDVATAVAVQPDGKIVIAGSGAFSDLDVAVMRFNQDGSLDSTFDDDGRVYFDFGSGDDVVGDMVVQPDGKVVVVGSGVIGGTGTMSLVRFLADGSLDDSMTVPFGVNARGLGVALQPDGKIVIAGRVIYPNTGSDFAVARLNPDLTMDTSFSTDGMTDWDFGYGGADIAYDVAIRGDGKIVIAGTAYDTGQSVFGLMVYSTTGAPQFLGVARFTADASGLGLALQPDGKAIVSGRCSTDGGDIAVARFNTNGTLDASFGVGGMNTFSHLAAAEEYGRRVIVQHSGKIVVGGYVTDGGAMKLALVRWNDDGSPDSGFDDGNPAFSYTYTDVLLGYEAAGFAISQGPDGKILVAGMTGSSVGQLAAVARFQGDEDLIFVDGFESGNWAWW